MPGLVPGIHVLLAKPNKDVDGRDKPGHDEGCDGNLLPRSVFLVCAARFGHASRLLTVAAPSARRHALAVLILCAPLTAGCAVGDFGRAPGYAPLNARPSALQLVFGPAGVQLTDDEKQLRRIADTIVAPAPSIAPWVRLGPDPFLGTPVDQSLYARSILTGPFRSATARYERLINDVRNDMTQLDQFLPVARRVADLDQKREQSLRYVTGLGEAEFAAAQARVDDNILVLTRVVECLRKRAAVYRLTLERLVILLPSPMATEAERVWQELDRRIAAIQVVGPRPVAVAAGPEAPVVVSK